MLGSSKIRVCKLAEKPQHLLQETTATCCSRSDLVQLLKMYLHGSVPGPPAHPALPKCPSVDDKLVWSIYRKEEPDWGVFASTPICPFHYQTAPNSCQAPVGTSCVKKKDSLGSAWWPGGKVSSGSCNLWHRNGGEQTRLGGGIIQACSWGLLASLCVPHPTPSPGAEETALADRQRLREHRRGNRMMDRLVCAAHYRHRASSSQKEQVSNAAIEIAGKKWR